jgi:hypothetical protein
MQPEFFGDGGPGHTAGARVDCIAAGPAASAWVDAGAIVHRAMIATMTRGKTGLFQLDGRVAACVMSPPAGRLYVCFFVCTAGWGVTHAHVCGSHTSTTWTFHRQVCARRWLSSMGSTAAA